MNDTTTGPPPVVLHIPATLGPLDVLVQHQPWGEVEVSVRPLHTNWAWKPLADVGGTFEVRAA